MCACERLFRRQMVVCGRVPHKRARRTTIPAPCHWPARCTCSGLCLPASFGRLSCSQSPRHALALAALYLRLSCSLAHCVVGRGYGGHPRLYTGASSRYKSATRAPTLCAYSERLLLELLGRSRAAHGSAQRRRTAGAILQTWESSAERGPRQSGSGSPSGRAVRAIRRTPLH